MIPRLNTFVHVRSLIDYTHIAGRAIDDMEKHQGIWREGVEVKTKNKPKVCLRGPPSNVYRFLTNPNLIIICTCAALYYTTARREGTTVFGEHNPSVLYYCVYNIYVHARSYVYVCECVCIHTGRRYNDNSYCCILYTPAGPIVCGGLPPSVGRHTWTIVTRRRRRRRHTCDTPPPRRTPPKTQAGDLVTMAHWGGLYNKLHVTLLSLSVFLTRTHTHWACNWTALYVNLWVCALFLFIIFFFYRNRI